jgi:hypothetical protein
LNRVGSSIVALKQSAVTGPTPGTVMNLRTSTPKAESASAFGRSAQESLRLSA